MLPKDGVDLVLRAMRTPGSRPGRTRNGFHSPTLTDPHAQRMTGLPDGYTSVAYSSALNHVPTSKSRFGFGLGLGVAFTGGWRNG